MNLYRRFLIFASLLTLCFALPLAHWARFALNSGLFSYVLLVPFISGYLIWIRRTQVVIEGGHARLLAVMLAAAGLGFLAAGMVGSAENVLTYQVLSYCCFLWSGGLALFGLRIMRWLAFPALFLVFIAPIPPGIVTALETALQHASADCAYRFIRASNIPVYRSDMSFYMPNFSMRVAHECSGIRSSLILFISALVAGHMFLRTSWTRWILALFVIPLGIVRNAFRILVLALLCVRVDPSYIHSPIHTQGGPFFFILSLVPFGIVLFLLRRVEK
jgi:exosortase C (VPDSG-CTERM-specific)